jgi:hypothetical protein
MNCKRRRDSIVKGAMDLVREDLGPIDPTRPKPKPMTDQELAVHYGPLAKAYLLAEDKTADYSDGDVELMAGILMLLDGREEAAARMFRGLIR